MASRKSCLVFILLAIGLGLSAEAHAIFELTVSPRRGGQNIRFESAAPGGLLRNEEVTLTVTTDRNAQYQILQTMYQPLTNEFGNTIPAGSFVQFSPSGSQGTLRTQLETPVTMGQKQIYTSEAGGASDEFVLVFNVLVPEEQPGGVYHTQLTFSAELINAQSGTSPSLTTLDVRVEINPKFRITLQNVKGVKALDLGRITREKVAGGDTLTLKVESNIGTRYRLFQHLAEPLSSSMGDTLEENTLTFLASGGSAGSLTAQGSDQGLPAAPSLFYQSDERGAPDQIQIQYVFSPPLSQKAGVYTGNLSFRVESNSPFVPNEVLIVPVKLEIESIFGLDTQIDGGALNFGMYRSGEEKQQKKVFLKVRSNLGEPYQISQVVSRPMTNDAGAVIPSDYFQVSGQEVKTGVLSVPSPSPVKEGEKVIFTSDKKGTPEDFTLNYELSLPKGAQAGSYHTELKYSITTL